MFRSLLNTGMGRTTLWSGFLAFLLPIVLAFMMRKAKLKRYQQYLILFLYCLGIIYLTLLKRSIDTRSINIIPFWSYTKWNKVDVRWQVYMNVFLFIPFGFLMLWITDWKLWQIALTGFVFSIVIETCQFLFRLGYSEFDDLWHNTLGTVIGYGYCRMYLWLCFAYGEKIRRLWRIVFCSVILSAELLWYSSKAIVGKAWPWIKLLAEIGWYWIIKSVDKIWSDMKVISEKIQRG